MTGLEKIGEGAKRAERTLMVASTEVKNKALSNIAKAYLTGSYLRISG